MLEATVDDRGRILIPKKIRHRLGLQPGANARIEVESDRLIIIPPVSADRFVQKMEGCITEGKALLDPLKLKEIWEQPKKGLDK